MSVEKTTHTDTHTVSHTDYSAKSLQVHHGWVHKNIDKTLSSFMSESTFSFYCAPLSNWVKPCSLFDVLSKTHTHTHTSMNTNTRWEMLRFVFKSTQTELESNTQQQSHIMSDLTSFIICCSNHNCYINTNTMTHTHTHTADWWLLNRLLSHYCLLARPAGMICCCLGLIHFT